MAVQRYISSSFWSDDWVDSLSVKEKLTYLYLLTNDSTSICGVYTLTVKRIKDDTGISREEIQEILQKFADDKKAYYVDEYIILPNWLKHQHLNNESVKLGTIRALKALPNNIIAFLREADHFYYNVDDLLGPKKEAKQPQPVCNTCIAVAKQTEQESENTAENNTGTTQAHEIPAQKTAVQDTTSTPLLPHTQRAVPQTLGGVPTQHPINPSKSAHDSDSDLEKESLSSLEIPTNLERRGMSENATVPEEPAQHPQKKAGKKKSLPFIKPTIDEIAEYCRQRNNTINPDTFFNFYESKGGGMSVKIK